MVIKEENYKNMGEDQIPSERLTIYRILDLYNLINKENQFDKAAFVKYSGTSERTIKRDIKCLNEYFKRNYENEGSNGVYREISYCRKDKDYASRVLLHVNYYRLSGYTLTLRRDNIFYNNVKLEQVMEIYNFDTELRVITEKL